MKKFCSLFLAFLILLGCLATVNATGPDTGESVPEESSAAGTEPQQTQPAVEVPTVSWGDASVSNGCKTLDAAVPLGTGENILDTAKSAFLYEVGTDTVLYTLNPDMQVYPASLVKLMTCLIALENGDPDDVVTVRQETLDTIPWDAAVIDLSAGEELTLRDLLYATMVSSANDAAAVAAEHIAGSQEAFVAQMNDRAAGLGCTNTHFANVHGLHDEQQYTTARDMARIMKEALKNEAFLEYFNEDYYVIEPTNMYDEQRPLFTSNYLMSTLIAQEFYDDRVTGGKTGVTANDGWCLVSTAQDNGVSLLSIVMDAQSVYAEDGYSVSVYGNLEDTATLIDYGFDNFQAVELIYRNQSLTQCPVINGENDVVLGAAGAASAAVPAGVGLDSLQRKYILYSGDLTAPLEKGAAVGTVQIWYNSICIAQCEMVTLSPVAVAAVTNQDSRQDAVTDEGGSGMGNVLKIFGIVFLVILGVGVLLFVMAAIRSALIRSRRRRRRKNRRRSR